MNTYSATILDLSSFDRRSIWPLRLFDPILAARLERLKSEMQAAGIAFDTEKIAGETSVRLQRVDGFREWLMAQALDDAQASVLLAFAQGLMLDRKGDMHATARQALVADPRPYTEAPEDWEDDERYRRRIQLAPETFGGAGTAGMYEYHAKAASPDVRDARVFVVNRGKVDVTVEVSIMANGPTGEPSAELMRTVRAHLLRDDIKLLTDAVQVRPARPMPYAVRATLLIPPGPDASIIRATAVAALQAKADDLRRIGRTVPHSAIVAALHVPGVDSAVQVMPAADIEPLRFQYALLTDIDLEVEVLRG
ncbi:MAG: baseplate J/gp47 family protein [Parvibaculum sp.]|uniref:baseplate assembly protein n=1 Tax=Chelatococcus sp. TaxID=1953771 RepID=UPI001EBF4FA5|nr:baseplate J/gp47 family protein [Chelatococcus sp.]MBX3506845.1 baseplate J/gp47 family protein [Parvibaculum sp.]MBX3545592.1 baseplate J/gp47 family protein [Chelatococcus sp.]